MLKLSFTKGGQLVGRDPLNRIWHPLDPASAGRLTCLVNNKYLRACNNWPRPEAMYRYVPACPTWISEPPTWQYIQAYDLDNSNTRRLSVARSYRSWEREMWGLIKEVYIPGHYLHNRGTWLINYNSTLVKPYTMMSKNVFEPGKIDEKGMVIHDNT